jgi:NAD(P)-dependent dehydrogenase (short-subunit alcohol dehydrogenase family)
MIKKLEGKVAVVTGASRGIGRGIALALAGEGASLVLSARSTEGLEQTAADCREKGVKAFAVAGNVADPELVARVFATVQSEFGQLDLLVNNAGAFDGGPLDELSLEAWDHVIATNLRGPFLCTQAAMRIMKPQKSGRIINVGSISSHRVRPNSAAYSASKHGIWGLSQVTALEGRPFGITCCCLKPGNVRVPHRAVSTAPQDQEPMMVVEEVAEVALLMATLPPHVEMLEATVLPRDQMYVGRG